MKAEHGGGVCLGAAVGVGVVGAVVDGVAVGLGETEATVGVADETFPAVGVGSEPQADAANAVTASARNQVALFIACSGNGSGLD
ncbi:MAG TPA: hypothetical protein VHW94_06395 [Candidatus Dormibacteraeota bacterium]|nr:hypothetical protein [Candidatus Dormibacteraeota bacterium]